MAPGPLQKCGGLFCWYNGAFYVTQQTKALPDVLCLVAF
jgi:hypothetical protein